MNTNDTGALANGALSSSEDMSALSGTQGPTFTPVETRPELSKAIIVRPSELAEQNFKGLVATGVYEGSIENKYNSEKLDFKIRSANGDLTIINETSGLRRQMELVSVGSLVQIEYNGKKNITKGEFAGKSKHLFTVSVA